MGDFAPALGLQAHSLGNGGQMPAEPVPYPRLHSLEQRNFVRIGELPPLRQTEQDIEALLALEQAENAFGHVISLSNKL
ncbi:hypothetical protein [Novosphingobium pentaromativorans]|uniref:hypothetical protein n=1 Tax=Novosphingobium pentaromativorans TaxID=205844 RepID=UPI00129AB4F5|nr:hypothetical protein [Novosphingobium pentaromativorans]